MDSNTSASTPRDHSDRLIGGSTADITTAEELNAALEHVRAVRGQRIGELLLANGIINARELEAALRAQKSMPAKLLGEVLFDLGLLSRDQLLRTLSAQLGVPYVRLEDFAVDRAMLKALPAELVRSAKVFPLCYRGDALVVATADPREDATLQRVRFFTENRVIPVLASPEAIERAAGQHYSDRGGGNDLQDLVKQLRAEIGAQIGKPGTQMLESDSKLVRLVNRIIVDAHAWDASDIHIESNPDGDPVTVRFRIDGVLNDYLTLPPELGPALVSRIKVMSGIDISERRRAQDGRINFREFGPIEIELRVLTLPTRDQLEDVVMRLLRGGKPLPVAQIGMSPRMLATMRELTESPHGLVLVVGPTGSGKTTTLHSLISEINRPGMKICTAENPVEITQRGLRQVQVHPKIGWDFATVMRAFLRADPDVIMVGEMRDAETAGIAVEASLTGHLVFSTLHTNSSSETVVRLLDMGVDPFTFADSLRGVLAQRLARRLCRCAGSRVATDAEISALAQEYCYDTELEPDRVIAGWREQFGPELRIYSPKGCDACRLSGYRGRVGLFELLAVTSGLREMIITRAPAAELRRVAIQDGMRTLKQDGIEKCLAGLTDISEVRAAAV